MVKGGVLLDATKNWECPSCLARYQTKEARPHVPMHPCPKLGIIAPYVEVGERARHLVVEREDYVGDELVRHSLDGRPIMAVRTERWDGSNDCHVMAPTATNVDPITARVMMLRAVRDKRKASSR